MSEQEQTTIDAKTATEEYLATLRPTPARVVRVIKRETEDQKKARLAAKEGEYRVIHGSVMIPIPLENRLLPDNTENPYLPRQQPAQAGDIVWLNDADALFMLEHDIVEALDSRPSRVGKVCEMELHSNSKKSWDYQTVKGIQEARAARAV